MTRGPHLMRGHEMRAKPSLSTVFAVFASLGVGFSSMTLGGCGAADDKAGSAEFSGSGATGGGTGGSASIGSGGGGGTGPGTGGTSGSAGSGSEPPPDPELELESAFEVPVATNRYVWTANTTTNRVALINAETFEVALTETGLAPTTVAGLPGRQDGAIVLNAGSEDATLVLVNE